MRKKKKNATLPSLLLALGLAALGQAFLVRQEVPWTLFPGLALFVAAGFLWARTLKGGEDRTEPRLSPSLEAALFAAILLVGLFFRAYHLGQYPPGLYSDAARQGYGALRILHEGWGPFQEPDLYMGGSLASGFYESALWFKFFPATPVSLLWASVTLSLLAFPFFYWFFRQLAGPRVALITLFLFAVMRWGITYAQGGHPATDYPLYLFGTLACWLTAVRTGNRAAFAAFILFTIGGSYSYEAFVAVFPALIVLGLYEYRQDPKAFRKYPWLRAGGAALFVGLTLPIWKLHWARGGFGAVYDQTRLLAPRETQADLISSNPILDHLLMYNRHGDLWFYHNIPGHRLLDDGTGVLWVLGLALTLWSFRERISFYALTLWGFLALPAILSSYPPHASRALGCAGFVALFAALGLAALARRVAQAFPKMKWSGPLVLGLALALIALLNFRTYFGAQAKDLTLWRDEGWAATLAGEKIARTSGEEVFVASRFFGHYSVLFQSYRKDLHPFPTSTDLPEPLKRGFLFLLDEGKTGTLQWLQGLYPGGETEKMLDQEGHPLVYGYRVAAGTATDPLKAYQRSAQGLTAAYYFHGSGNGKPDLVQREPLINFTFRNDFPVPGPSPFNARWTGILLAPAAGDYGFVALTTDECRLSLDGREVLGPGKENTGKVRLTKGPHRLELGFNKSMGFDAALSLLWVKPGDVKYGVVPASAYRLGTSPAGTTK